MNVIAVVPSPSSTRSLSRDICRRNSCPSKIPKLPPINPALPLSDPSVCAYVCARNEHTWAISTQGELVRPNTPVKPPLENTGTTVLSSRGAVRPLAALNDLHDHYESRQSIDNSGRMSKSPSRKRREEPKRLVGLEDGDGGYYFCYAGSNWSCGNSVAPSGLSYYNETVAPKWLPLQRRCERINDLALW